MTSIYERVRPHRYVKLFGMVTRNQRVTPLKVTHNISHVQINVDLFFVL